MTKLILGTAQFGAGYGITNATGRIHEAAMRQILAVASDFGIETFDTAADYGDSESRLGSLLRAAERHYVTKFSLPADSTVPITAELLFERSAETLGIDALDGVLFHRVSDLEDPRRFAALEILRAARESGQVGRIGVSIYDSEDLELALRSFPDLDLLQLPGNVVDRRLLDNPKIAELRHAGVEIHVRSAFLQGLLLSVPTALPQFFSPLLPILDALARQAVEGETSVLGLVIRFLRDHKNVDGVVVGATTARELATITAEWDDNKSEPVDINFALPSSLLDPRSWPAIKVLS